MPGSFIFALYMITKAQIKFIQSLRQPDVRRKEGLYMVEGVKMVNELLASNHNIVTVYVVAGVDFPDNVGNNEVVVIEDWELEKISNLTTPNKMLAIAAIPKTSQIPDLHNELVLYLDRISDPGNMGTIIRTAEWFGINHIYASSHSVDFWNPKVVQASMGSVFRINLNILDIGDLLDPVSNIPVYGTLLDGEPITNTKLSSNGIIIVGNESTGISADTQRYITRKLTIPAAASSLSESLNASVATAIVCYEFKRQFAENFNGH